MEGYTNLDVARFFVESARILAEKRSTKRNNNDALKFASIVNFINTIACCNYSFEVRDMFNNENRNANDINIIKQEDVLFYIKAAKQLYMEQVLLSDDKYATPKDHLLADRHMYGEIDESSFTDQDVFDNINEFLIHTGKCRDVKVSKDDLQTTYEKLLAYHQEEAAQQK